MLVQMPESDLSKSTFGAMSSLAEIKPKFTEALGRMSSNERRLLGGFILVLLAAAPIKAAGVRQEAAARHDEVQAQLDRMRQTARSINGGVGAELNDDRREVRDWSWQAENIEVGRVLVQDRISDMADDAGLSDVDVKLDPKTERAGEVQLVPLELSANFSWTGLSTFVSAMDAAGKGFIIDSVEMPDGDKPRLKLKLRAPLIVRPAAAAPARAAT